MGRLVRQSMSKVLGPAVWSAAAMATQQHYLVSIDTRLASMEEGITELMAQNRDERLGTLDAALRQADRVLDAVRDGRRVSTPAVMQLINNTQTADAKLHELLHQAERHAEKFAKDEGKAGETEAAWADLLYALQVLSRCSLALVSLPQSDADELDAISAEERQRHGEPIERTRALAGKLLTSDHNAREAFVRWEDWKRKRRQMAAVGGVMLVAPLAAPAAGAAAGGATGAARAAARGAGRAAANAAGGAAFAGATTRTTSEPHFDGVKGPDGPNSFVIGGVVTSAAGLIGWAPKRRLSELHPSALDTLLTVASPAEEAPQLLVAVHAGGDVEVRALTA